MAEKELEHRQEQEKETNKKIYNLNSRGQIFGFGTLLICVATIILSIIFNQPIAAIVPAIISICSLIAVYSGKK